MAWADDDALRAAQSQSAQVVVVTRTAAILCPGIQVDEEAIRALMDDPEITDRDIMGPDRFGPEDKADARGFKSSVTEDPTYVTRCSTMRGSLVPRPAQVKL